MSDPLTILGHLAEEGRLRVFAAVLLGAADPAEVARRTGLSVRDVLRALIRLDAADLVRNTGTGWQARPELLRETVVAAAPERVYIDHGVDNPDEASVLRTFMPEGALLRIPAQWSKRRVVLDQICRVFEPGRRYGEREVNAILQAFHPDYAALRRYLVDEGFMARGEGQYWRSGGTVEI